MYILTVNDRYGEQKKIKFDSGKNLLEVLKENGVMIENPCAGKGYCGKCKIKILNGIKDKNLEEHKRFLSEEEILDNIRLACLYQVDRDIDIELLHDEKKVEVLDEGYMPEFDLSPAVRKECQVFSEKSLLQTDVVESLLLEDKEELPLDVIKRFSNLKEGETYTVTRYNGKIISIENGDTRNLIYGFAVDIGTTTLVVSLIDLNTGKEIKSASSINPQKSYGLDVLSRINFASKEKNGAEILSKVVVECLNNLFNYLCDNNKIAKENVYDVTIAANTTMLHLLLGINPKSLGVNPYRPIFKDSKTFLASDVGLEISDYTRLYCLPSVSAFIGADITSGAIVANLKKVNQKVLFIDIGTNGEMILSNCGKLIACSCAAGPALEGMNITCGIRAGDGAIEGVSIKEEGIQIDIIGVGNPNGICGSGILDAISEIYKVGLINKSGRLKKKDDLNENDFLKNLLIEDGKKRSIVLSKKNNIYITQNDIRQVQLAKGAILSGILSMLYNLKLNPKDIDKVIIAGQFGAHLKVESIVGVGMVPIEFKDKISYIGNSSKSGAILCLLDVSKRDEVNDVLKTCDYLELSLLEDYERLFANCLSFDISKLSK